MISRSNIPPMLDYAGYAAGVEGLGPGKRVVLWVRGCAIGCPGCMTPELWEAGKARPLSGLIEELTPLLAGADGLTISGGEPFDQPGALAILVDALRASPALHALETLVYTGYAWERLRAYADGSAPAPLPMTRLHLPAPEDVAALLARIDLLIDSPFVQTAANTLQWRGSDNQRVHLLSSQAKRYEPLKDDPMPAQRILQVQMLGTARYRLIGIPHRGDLQVFRAAMAARGFTVKPEHE